MTIALCTLCLKNIGLRLEAEQVASDTGPQCPTCGQTGGRVVNLAAAEQIMHRFFVHGSIPPEICGPAPLYEFNTYQYPGDVAFATELDEDLRLLSEFLHVGLFHYGPALWRLGYTEHYTALRGNGALEPALEGEERARVWNKVLARCAVKTIGPDVRVFRVRKGEVLPPALPEHFDTPPESAPGQGRYDSELLPVFYGTEDVETCLHESRVTLADWIAVGSFVPARPLRLLDLADDIDDSTAQTPFERVDILMAKLAFAGTEDYDLCREMATKVHALGVDGFYYKSYFAQAHKRSLRNIALFGRPAREGKLRLISVNRVRLESVEYKFRFGPTNDTSLQMDAADWEVIIEQMKQGGDTAKEAKAKLDQLLARKSQGPR